MSQTTTTRHSDEIGSKEEPTHGTRTMAVGTALLVAELGWTRDEAADTRTRLLPFDAEWDALGMDA